MRCTCAVNDTGSALISRTHPKRPWMYPNGLDMFRGELDSFSHGEHREPHTSATGPAAAPRLDRVPRIDHLWTKMASVCTILHLWVRRRAARHADSTRQRPDSTRAFLASTCASPEIFTCAWCLDSRDPGPWVFAVNSTPIHPSPRPTGNGLLDRAMKGSEESGHDLVGFGKEPVRGRRQLS